MPLKQSFCWWCFANRGVSDLALLYKAREIGYEAVEMLDESLFEQAHDCGFVIATIKGQQSLQSGFNDVQEHSRLESEIYANLALAQKYAIPNLILFSGNRRPGLTDEAGMENTARGLLRVSKAAEDAGVTLLLELLNSKNDHPGYQCDHTSWGVSVCRLVGSPCVKLLYDIYHMQIMEGNLIHTLGAQHADFGHYHTAGVPGRHDLDGAQEINYPALLRFLGQSGYDGYIGHEFIPKGDPAAALEAAWQLCRT